VCCVFIFVYIQQLSRAAFHNSLKARFPFASALSVTLKRAFRECFIRSYYTKLSTFKALYIFPESAFHL